jgi:hypothetical protein
VQRRKAAKERTETRIETTRTTGRTTGSETWMGNGPLFSSSILSFHLYPLSSILSSFFFAPLRLCTFAFFSSRVFSSRVFSSRVFSSSQPRQEQQRELGTFGV